MEVSSTDSQMPQPYLDIEERVPPRSPPTLSSSTVDNHTSTAMQSFPTLASIPAKARRYMVISTAKWPSGRLIKITKFTIFPKLPVELRRLIWELALPGPRVVTVKSRYRTVSYPSVKKTKTIEITGDKIEGPAPNPCRYKSRARGFTDVPVLLTTCGESRSVALEHYELSFSAGITSQPVYFDFSKDILHILTWDTFLYRTHAGLRTRKLCTCSDGAFEKVHFDLLNKPRHTIVSKKGCRGYYNAKLDYKALETLVMSRADVGVAYYLRSKAEDEILLEKPKQHFQKKRSVGMEIPKMYIKSPETVQVMTGDFYAQKKWWPPCK